MLLVIDAGNSNVTFGVFDGAVLLTHWRIRTETGRTRDEYAAFLGSLFAQSSLAMTDVSGIALASVVPGATPALRRLAQQTFGLEPLEVTAKIDLGLEIGYSPPGDVGTDRLVDAVAAVHKYGAPCIVLDFGSATTFNAIAAPVSPNALPLYLGGAICLGIGLSLETLFAKAAKIPRVELAPPPRAIGGNTIHALQSGIVLGTLSLVDGLIARFREEMAAPDCPVIATGGYASELLAAASASITHLEPNLTLDGLRLLFDRSLQGT
ncbi:MAG: type III pantothenate kinase [Janthinobacterium lividum]